MGSGRSGIYYGTHGSRIIHHKALIHSLEGEYTTPSKKGTPIRLKSGGMVRKQWILWTKTV